MQLRGLDIILTYECTSHCAHCCYRCGPGRNTTMTVKEVEGYLRAVAHHPLEGILLFGGEPFLAYDVLLASLPLATSLSPQVYVFTNGSWATDPLTARRKLEGLRQAGLDYVLFSVDAFHQAHVPLDRIAIGITAARDVGYRTIEIDNRFLGEPATDNALNRRTRAYMARLGELCDLTGMTVHSGPARMVGRAADELSSLTPTEEAATDHCPLPDYLGGELREPTAVEIHPDGWVNLCAGLALGRANGLSLDRILANHSVDGHPIIRVLAEKGPGGLLALAMHHGYAPAECYVDGCHLCYEARRFLRPYFPEYLAPAHPYLPG